MVGLETNFESTTPIPRHVETKTISLRSRPRPRPQKIGLETYIIAFEKGERIEIGRYNLPLLYIGVTLRILNFDGKALFEIFYNY